MENAVKNSFLSFSTGWGYELRYDRRRDWTNKENRQLFSIDLMLSSSGNLQTNQSFRACLSLHEERIPHNEEDADLYRKRVLFLDAVMIERETIAKGLQTEAKTIRNRRLGCNLQPVWWLSEDARYVTAYSSAAHTIEGLQKCKRHLQEGLRL